MIVRATLPASLGADSGIQANAVAFRASVLRRYERAERHAFTRGFLADPSQLDRIVPGLSSLPPGMGNDRLRALRFGSPGIGIPDLPAVGAQHLSCSPAELRAAIVAQRIRCWRAIHGR